MKVSKKLTSKSGMTIPKQMRAELGILPSIAVDMESTPQGTIVIRKRVPICRFCGSVQDTITVSGIEMCRACAKKLVEEVETHV
ncbi:MAG: AbrB/MazE/SpoVT family DNA-binding domain-containing protein [Candidatus Fimivivens sp.]